MNTSNSSKQTQQPFSGTELPHIARKLICDQVKLSGSSNRTEMELSLEPWIISQPPGEKLAGCEKAEERFRRGNGAQHSIQSLHKGAATNLLSELLNILQC